LISEQFCGLVRFIYFIYNFKSGNKAHTIKESHSTTIIQTHRDIKHNAYSNDTALLLQCLKLHNSIHNVIYIITLNFSYYSFTFSYYLLCLLFLLFFYSYSVIHCTHLINHDRAYNNIIHIQ